MDVPAYVAYLRTQAKKADGMSEAEAQRTVELEDREAAVAAREEARAEREAAERQAEQAKASAEARRQADIEEFTKTFPDVAKDPKAIPASVWNDVKGGMSLVAAYARYAVAKAQSDAAAQVAVSVKNENNAARATGSMNSAGNDTKTRDPFLEGWDS
jgi:multidrug efflux pump subunit AcrA (membrane-fusion protein)